MSQERLLSEADVAAMLRVTTRTVCNYRHRAAHPLPFKKIGGRIYYPEQEVIDWIREEGSTGRKARA